MKKLLKTIVFMNALLLLALGSFAQSQYEAMKNLAFEKPYDVYEVSGKSGSYQVGSLVNRQMYFF